MKIALFGATGMIGQRILNEALRRGHEVTAIARDPSSIAIESANLSVAASDILDPRSVSVALEGHDAVISAFGPRGEAVHTVSDAARALIVGLEAAGIRRLVIVGGAGSLEVAPGVQLVDAPDFPSDWKAVALAHRDSLDIYRRDGGGLDWTYVSPAALIEPGDRTGQFRLGGDQLLTDAEGQSRISAEDYAVALLDEVEIPKHIRQRFTVAY